MAAKKSPDPLVLLASLPSTTNYLPTDRYHDFRKVFNTPEGQRVLNEILSWGRIFSPSLEGDPIDPYKMAVGCGEKNVALKLLATYNNEPPVQPGKQRS